MITKPWSEIFLLTESILIDKDIAKIIRDDLFNGTIFMVDLNIALSNKPCNIMTIRCRRRNNPLFTEFWITNSERKLE